MYYLPRERERERERERLEWCRYQITLGVNSHKNVHAFLTKNFLTECRFKLTNLYLLHSDNIIRSLEQNGQLLNKFAIWSWIGWKTKKFHWISWCLASSSNLLGGRWIRPWQKVHLGTCRFCFCNAMQYTAEW